MGSIPKRRRVPGRHSSSSTSRASAKQFSMSIHTFVTSHTSSRSEMSLVDDDSAVRRRENFSSVIHMTLTLLP